MSGSEQVFATKVDAWLAAVMVTSLVGSLVAVAVAARETPRDAAIAGAVVLASFALVAAVAIPTRYTIAERELEIRSGMLRYRIPMDAILRVYPTRNPLSAPAWSLDRLGIEWRKGRARSLALVSPVRREQFLELLARHAGLVASGGELRRQE